MAARKRNATPQTLKTVADNTRALPGIAKKKTVNNPIAAFSPDGKILAVAYSDSSREYRGVHDWTHPIHEVLIWNADSQKKVKIIAGNSGEIGDLDFTTDGKLLICGGGDKDQFMGGEITVWDTGSWKLTATIQVGENIRCVAVSPDSRLLAAGTSIHSQGLRKVTLIDLAEQKIIRQFAKQIDGGIDSLAFSPDGKLLALGACRTVSLWHVQSGRKKCMENAHQNNIHLVFSPDSKTLASCGDEAIILWDVKSGRPRQFLERQTSNVDAICFSADGTKLATAGWRESVSLWNTSSGKKEKEIPFAHSKGVVASIREMRFWPDDTTLTAVHYHGIVSRWNLDNPNWMQTTKPDSVTESLEDSTSAKKLVQQIVKNPDEDGPRLKYADWLEENGDSDRAELIRVQCECAILADEARRTRKKMGTRISGLRRKANRLIEKNFAKWASRLAGLNLTLEDVEFRRGMMHTVRLSSVEFTNDSVKVLEAIPELEVVNLSGSGVTDDGLVHLKPIPNLHWLDVCDTKITTAGLAHLNSHKRLYRVYQSDWGNGPNPDLQKFMKIRNRFFDKLDDELKRKEALHALGFILDGYNMQVDADGMVRSISYSQSWATDADLNYLKVFPELERLDFFECGAVTSRGLESLAPLNSLKDICLTESGVTDLKPLRNLKSLETVDLSSLEQLDESSFQWLAELTSLRHLTINFCHLSDAVMPYIANIPSLETIDMVYNNVTDEGLDHLRKLPNLQQIDVDYKKRRRNLIREIIAG